MLGRPMVGNMARMASPNHIKRSRIVVMVCLWLTLLSTCGAFFWAVDFSSSHGVCKNNSSSSFLWIFNSGFFNGCPELNGLSVFLTCSMVCLNPRWSLGVATTGTKMSIGNIVLMIPSLFTFAAPGHQRASANANFKTGLVFRDSAFRACLHGLPSIFIDDSMLVCRCQYINTNSPVRRI